MSILTPSITSAVLDSSPNDTVSSTRPKPSKKDEKSAKQQMADYELPPRHYALGNHYYHYGWPVTDDSVEEILVKLKVPLPPPAPDVLVAHLGWYLMRRLRLRDGFSYVWCKSKGRVLIYKEEGKEEIPHVALLTIGCTYSKETFYSRPTQKAFETLIEVFGERPRWLQGLEIREEYASDMMNS